MNYSRLGMYNPVYISANPINHEGYLTPQIQLPSKMTGYAPITPLIPPRNFYLKKVPDPANKVDKFVRNEPVNGLNNIVQQDLHNIPYDPIYSSTTMTPQLKGYIRDLEIKNEKLERHAKYQNHLTM